MTAVQFLYGPWDGATFDVRGNPDAFPPVIGVPQNYRRKPFGLASSVDADLRDANEIGSGHAYHRTLDLPGFMCFRWSPR